MLALGLAMGAILMVYAIALYFPPYLYFLGLAVAIVYGLIARRILIGKNANKTKQTPS